MTHSTNAYDPARARRTLFQALIDARRDHGADRPILVDGDERVLTYEDLTRAVLALGHALKKGTGAGESVGVLLPTGIGSAIAVLALSAYGRLPAMLNFTAGIASIEATLKVAGIERIVTAHRFIEVGKFEALETSLKQCAELVYLEDVREQLTFFDKGAALLGSFLPGAVTRRASPDAPAVILFTSGTEGDPKGVVLSHANILANVEQVRAHVEFTGDDIVFNPLPLFHSFGLTVGCFMPLFLGIKAVQHPSPRQPHEIVRRVSEHKATILLATDTFITQYLRVAGNHELASLRLAVCGAERVREETRQAIKRKYRVELIEGYGVTEAAPVISANRPGANRVGTVGHLLPQIQSRLDPVEGIHEGGRLFVKGPNIMLGYLDSKHPGEVVAPKDGWHDTGDVVAIDSDGYLSIRGRVKRFAKIGGETVSLTVVENCAGAIWPDHAHAAVSLPDGRKGEQIMLLTTNENAARSDFVVWAHNHGVSELAIPRRVVPIAEIPMLGTGKTDYGRVSKMATEILATAPSAAR